MQRVARIKNGIIENIEIASPEWVNENNKISDFNFVILSENDQPWIGHSYNYELKKFDRPCGCGENKVSNMETPIVP